MRVPAIFLCALLTAGCLDDRPSTTPDTPGTPDEEGRTARGGNGSDGGEADEGPERIRVAVGEVRGGMTDAGEVSFEVVIPSGGGREVQWKLEVDGPYTMDAEVLGPGCAGSIQRTGVGGNPSAPVSGAAYGTCSDLDAGTFAFRVVLQSPVLGYVASVDAAVLAHNASNATEP